MTTSQLTIVLRPHKHEHKIFSSDHGVSLDIFEQQEINRELVATTSVMLHINAVAFTDLLQGFGHFSYDCKRINVK